MNSTPRHWPAQMLCAHLLVISLLANTQSASAQVADPTTMNGKILPGYQGWFLCPGDGNLPNVGWRHWSKSTTSIGPNLYSIDLWPDVAEYPTVFNAPGVTLTFGGAANLYSAITASTVAKHFEWMRTYGIDGVCLQRFLSELADGNFFAIRNTVLQNVRSAANTYGRTFALEYDISGSDESTLYTNLTNDWIYLSNTYNLRNDPRYQYHNGKPVIIIWGLGFNDRPGTPTIANQIINFFKNDPTYGGCFCIGGVPGAWRTLGAPCKTDPAWNATYRSWNCIHPWTVGAYRTSTDITNFKNNYAAPDVTECNSLGIMYLPVVWPGFSWDNLFDLPPGTSVIDRRNGQHFWDQAYAFEGLSGVNKLFVAMFDECDEGTAIFKISDNVPNTNHWIGNNGYPADWWMRLAGSAGQMARGEIPLSGTIPISPFVSNICYAGDVSIDLGTTDVIDMLASPQPQGGDGNTTPVTIGGRDCRKNTNPNSDFYIYFGVNDSFAFQGSCQDIYVKMDYYDTGGGSLTLQYDAVSTAYKNGPSVTVGTTNTWKTTTFHVTDAYFGNRENGGMDFRIFAPAGQTFYLDVVRVAETGPVSIFTATPSSGTSPLVVAFNATVSYDPNGSITSYAWVFGDGGTGTGSTVNHTYNSGGNFTAQLTTTDNSGNTDVATLPISVASAGLIGSNFAISGGGCRFPDVAYGSVSAKYLVVWVDYGLNRVYGRLVTNGGVVSGNAFVISEFSALFPAVAYNATNNEFLVTWDDQRGPTYPIWGQRVRGSDGVLLGANFQIGATEGIRSAVAWGSTSNAYMVVYSTNSSETYVQRVGGQGGLIGGEINVSQDAAFSGYPAIAYGSNGNQFLVSWDSDVGNIYARRVDAGSGALLGGVVVMTAGGTNDRSCSAYDSVNSRWAVAYNKQITGLSYNQWARNINTSGTLVTAEYPIANTAGFEGDTSFGGDIAFVPGLAQYFSSFGTDTGWGGQPVDAIGNPIGSQIVLGTGANTSGNNAADPALSRFLPVWEGSVAGIYYVWGQLYQAVAAPPGPVTNFIASSSSGQNVLTWTNPVDSTFTGTLIRYRTDTYPTSPTDGTLVIDKANTPGTNDSYTHSGLTNGTTYYYSAWAHNSVPNYSNVRNANGTPTPAVCFTDSFAYANGNLNGNGGWSGSAGAEIQIVSQTVKINGGATAFDSVKTVTCGDPGTGFIRVTIKVQIGVGTTTMWSLWYDDAAGANLARWYGTGTTAKGRIGTTASVTADQFLTGGWDELMVKINPYNNTSEFFFNGVSIGVLDHTPTGATDTLGRLRFERTNNSAAAGHFLSFDDLSVGEPGSPLPGQASNPSPANGATLVAITTDPSWTAGSNATSHDVLFGTVNPPPFVINQTSTTYAAPTLTPNTLYYWRIDEKNASGTTTGTVWSFTTLPLPGAASAPNPASGATLVAITTDPSWTAGSNAASHDVRFGTVNPPPFVVNQTGTTYAAPTLNPNTLYYWRIDEINTSGTTTGTVWSFTTLPLPGLASAPNPANAATGVSITAALSWTAGSNATSHNVRYGTTNPPPFIQNQAGTSYTPPTKAPNTVYFWRIDEQNSSGTTTGTVWSFTTLPLPGLATAPNPANAATGVSITASLSWTAGSNAASHDVRFGTANPPPFIQNQAGTSYTPATMTANTTYFWRIDEKNTSGTTTGTVWSFTTLPLPGLATAPNPANAATGVSVTPTLSWTAGSNATSHDVRFGTANPPPFIQNQAGTSYSPGTLANSTVYYWRIDEKNSSGTTTGTVWSFTTVAAASCFSDSFVYADGNLNGNGSWSGSATNQIQIVSQTVKVNGGATSFDANRTISCTGSGGLIQVSAKVKSGSGANTMWNLWFNDSAGVNICRWYGTGTTARGRIGSSGIVTTAQTLTGGWDNLLVKINTTAKTAEFFFNSVSIGVLNYSGQGAGNTLGKLRFERIDNSAAAGNFLSFDDLVVY